MMAKYLLVLLLPLRVTIQVAPINPALGVLGFPDCVRKSPSILMDEYSAAMDLKCSQKQALQKTLHIACVGDSITAGATASSAFTTYPAQLEAKLNQAFGAGTFTVTNLGATGTTLQPGTYAYQSTPQYKALAESKWDAIIIMLGTNDAKSAIDPTAFSQQYQSLIAGLRSAPLGHPTIYVATPPPLMQNGDMGINQESINTILPRVLPGIASINAVKLINVFTTLGGSSTWASTFSDKCTLQTVGACSYFCNAQSCDQCHPNDVGYAAIAETVKNDVMAAGLSTVVPVRFV